MQSLKTYLEEECKNHYYSLYFITLNNAVFQVYSPILYNRFINYDFYREYGIKVDVKYYTHDECD